MEHGKMKKLLVVLTLAVMLVATTAQAQNRIYKTTDANGNVVYTDKPPPQGGQPMDLPELSIVSPRENQQPVQKLSSGSRVDAVSNQSGLPPAAQLRQTYSEAEITSPKQEETIWGTGSSTQINVDLKAPLLPGLMVQMVFDGRKLEPRPSASITLEQIDRGEHTVFAEVVDNTGEVFGRTEPVTFYMRQNSVNFNAAGRNNPGNNNQGNQ
jgi:hypothetical protein